jgi:hypothetical protein
MKKFKEIEKLRLSNQSQGDKSPCQTRNLKPGNATPNYRKFYALLGQLNTGGQDDFKEMMVLQFSGGRTEHVSAMKKTEYAAMMVALESKAASDKGDFAAYDTWRKRVIAVIGAWLKSRQLTGDPQGDQSSCHLIKAIACRAAGVDEFNRIPLNKLRALYGEWCGKNKISVETGALMGEVDVRLAQLN